MTIKEPHKAVKDNERTTTKRVGGLEGPPGRFVDVPSFSFAVSGGSLTVINLFCLYVISFRCLSLSSHPFVRPHMHVLPTDLHDVGRNFIDRNGFMVSLCMILQFAARNAQNAKTQMLFWASR